MRPLSIFISFFIIIASIATAQNVTVKSPNGGETWSLGETKQITWSANNITKNLKITLWQNGQFVGKITGTQDPKTGFYNWNVGSYEGGTAPTGTGYKIRIGENVTNTTIVDESNNPFTILQKIPFNPNIAKNIVAKIPKVTIPNKGTTWTERDIVTIRWETPLKLPFKVELYDYSGKNKIGDCPGQVKTEGKMKYSLEWHIPIGAFQAPGYYTIRVTTGNFSGVSEMFHITEFRWRLIEDS